MGRGDLTDAQWERLRPFLPVSNGRCGRWRDHRQVIDGILHRVRTGAQWRDLPERFGPWNTVYERHRLWLGDGTWERLLQQVQASADAAGEIDWDSENVKALSEYLGDGDPGFTLRTCTHLMPNSQARVRRAVDGVFREGGDTDDGPRTAQEKGNVVLTWG